MQISKRFSIKLQITTKSQAANEWKKDSPRKKINTIPFRSMGWNEAAQRNAHKCASPQSNTVSLAPTHATISRQLIVIWIIKLFFLKAFFKALLLSCYITTIIKLRLYSFTTFLPISVTFFFWFCWCSFSFIIIHIIHHSFVTLRL